MTSSGPTGGEVVLRDGRTPKSVGFILCVGSRDFKTNRWCSRTCCMHSMKLAQLVREHTGADVTIFYLDIRAPGKGCEEFYDKSLKDGIQFVRGRVAEVTDWALTPEEEGKLVIRAEDTLAGVVQAHPGRHDRSGRRHGGAGRRAAGAPPLQHELRDRGMVPGEAPQARPGQHVHRRRVHSRLLPGAEGHPGQHRPGGRRRGRGDGADRSRLHRAGTEHRLHRPRRTARAASRASRSAPTRRSDSTRRSRRRSINAALCKGCGTCVAACPSGSIHQHLFEDDEIFSEIEGVLAHA